MSPSYAPLIPVVLVALGVAVFSPAGAQPPEPLKITLRSRTAAPGAPAVPASEKAVEWNPKATAIIVCDMWDKHWCKSATARVGELAGPMDAMLKAARAKGVFVIHAPSETMNFYKDTPQRKRAQDAPKMPAPELEAKAIQRWNSLDAKCEGTLPIDDKDGGCDCQPHCKQGRAWSRQIAAITIAEEDAITDNGTETWNLLAGRKIDNVLVCGVHLNMCVLGRPFAIRSMVRVGKNVALIRDMTDTMYNPESRPQVSHFAGTDLVIEHVERYWCPSVTSTDFTGRPAAFRFSADPRR